VLPSTIILEALAGALIECAGVDGLVMVYTEGKKGKSRQKTGKVAGRPGRPREQKSVILLGRGGNWPGQRQDPWKYIDANTPRRKFEEVLPGPESQICVWNITVGVWVEQLFRCASPLIHTNFGTMTNPPFYNYQN
jgi:hypothetical protein